MDLLKHLSFVSALGLAAVSGVGTAAAAPSLIVNATKADGSKYEAGSWSNQQVRVVMTCSVNGQPVVGAAQSKQGPNTYVQGSGGTCVDAAGTPAPDVNFGPINIDSTAPTISLLDGSTGAPASDLKYTIDQEVAILCEATDPRADNAPGSGLAHDFCMNSVHFGYQYGVGTHVLTSSAIDLAGNVVTTSGKLTITVNPLALANLTVSLLNKNYPKQSSELYGIARTAVGHPELLATAMTQYRRALIVGGFTGNEAKAAIDLDKLSRLLDQDPELTPFIDNNNLERMKYSAGWAYYGNRPASVKDHNDDVHAASDNGAWVELSFLDHGSISYIGERSRDLGLVDVYLDNQWIQIVDAYGPVQNQGGQELFYLSGVPAGTHTLRLVKRSGPYVLLDGMIAQ